jgi:hypothetical protein
MFDGRPSLPPVISRSTMAFASENRHNTLTNYPCFMLSARSLIRVWSLFKQDGVFAPSL